eukprot:gene18675-20560_t
MSYFPLQFQRLIAVLCVFAAVMPKSKVIATQCDSFKNLNAARCHDVFKISGNGIRTNYRASCEDKFKVYNMIQCYETCLRNANCTAWKFRRGIRENGQATKSICKWYKKRVYIKQDYGNCTKYQWYYSAMMDREETVTLKCKERQRVWSAAEPGK